MNEEISNLSEMARPLTHNFVFECPSLDYLLDCDTLSSFIYRIKKVSKTSADNWASAQLVEIDIHGYTDDRRREEEYLIENDRRDRVNQYRGNAWELFTEYLMKVMGTHPQIGMMNYEPHQNNDFGVDGFGIGKNGKPMTLQAKFRTSQVELKYNEDHLGNFGFQSVMDFGVDAKPEYDQSRNKNLLNMIIFTCGKGLHYSVPHGNEFRVIAYNEIRMMVENHKMFFDGFRQSCKEARSS